MDNCHVRAIIDNLCGWLFIKKPAVRADRNGNWSELVAHADDGKTVVIDDPEDVAVLVKVFSNMKSDNGSDCGYYTYQITFEGNGKQETLYPAGDSCDTVYTESGAFYVMGRENRVTLASILLKYNIPMSAVPLGDG